MTPKEFAAKWFGNLDSRNYDGLKSMLSSSHQFDNPMTPQPVDGTMHLGLVQQMNATFTEGKHVIDQMIGEGDWVTVRATWSGKFTSEFNGLKPTGKAVVLPFTDIMHVVNGQLIEEYMRFDMQAFMQQLGGMQQPS